MCPVLPANTNCSTWYNMQTFCCTCTVELSSQVIVIFLPQMVQVKVRGNKTFKSLAKVAVSSSYNVFLTYRVALAISGWNIAQNRFTLGPLMAKSPNAGHPFEVGSEIVANLVLISTRDKGERMFFTTYLVAVSPPQPSAAIDLSALSKPSRTPVHNAGSCSVSNSQAAYLLFLAQVSVDLGGSLETLSIDRGSTWLDEEPYPSRFSSRSQSSTDRFVWIPYPLTG